MKSVIAALSAAAIGCAFAQPVFGAESTKDKEKVLHSFCSEQNCADGRTAYSGLVAVNGILYGTTWSGGTNCSNEEGCGAVFALDPKTGAETVIYSFCSLGPPDCPDGAFPAAGMIDVNGILYGTTSFGGTGGDNGKYCSPGCGTLFALDPSTGAETVLYSFCSQQKCRDGSGPWAAPVNVNGTLYGTTLFGGRGRGIGTVFAFSLKTGAEKTLYSFCRGKTCTGGNWPYAGLIDVNGTLYGTTSRGGASEFGTAFAIDPNSGAETVLHTFAGGADGANPVGGLIEVNGMLYGTTTGGTQNEGTVFSLDPATGSETVLYSFSGDPDGGAPYGSLINVNGMLYGVTGFGGAYDYGTVFAFDPATAMEMPLYSFCSQQNCPDGSTPTASLVDMNGKLYGTTSTGGISRAGTVFALKR
jgi:uncharacterized repeat protein (TIGR03803 family)